MAAAAAGKAKTKAAAGIPRSWLVALAAFVVFVFGGNWVVVAGYIADTVGRCLAVEEGSVWADDKCRHLMTYPPAVGVVSLLLMFVLCVREAEAESKVRKAGGGGAQAYISLEKVGFTVGQESCSLRGSDAVALGVMTAIYLCCFLVLVVGLAVRYAGSRRHLMHPADEGAAALVQSGSIITLAGCLALWFEYCGLVIPYVLLRLRRFIRANWDV